MSGQEWDARAALLDVMPFDRAGEETSYSRDPHYTVDLGTVPKAIDVVTLAGVSQTDELDCTLHQPVVLQAVTIP